MQILYIRFLYVKKIFIFLTNDENIPNGRRFLAALGMTGSIPWGASFRTCLTGRQAQRSGVRNLPRVVRTLTIDSVQWMEIPRCARNDTLP